MDIFFCDECGARVSDLDLRGGKGMRQRNDVICSGCVEQGQAAGWLARNGQSAAANGNGAVNGAAPVAVAEKDVISAARDRASTMPDDPFADEVQEPVAAPRPAAAAPAPKSRRSDPDLVVPPSPKTPAPAPGHETDAIPARRPEAQPVDSFAAAAGGFSALASQSASVATADDDLADGGAGDATSATAMPAPAATPFDSADADAPEESPGKAVTEEVPVVRGDGKADAKPENKSSSGRLKTASGRVAAQKKGGTSTSKRSASTKVTRRVNSSPLGSKKVLLLSLVSCTVMAIIFFAVVLPSINAPRSKGGPTIEMDEPMQNLQKSIDAARSACQNAQASNDLAVVDQAVASLRQMQESFTSFKRKADERGWTEANYEQQLRVMGYYEVNGLFKMMNERRARLSMP